MPEITNFKYPIIQIMIRTIRTYFSILPLIILLISCGVCKNKKTKQMEDKSTNDQSSTSQIDEAMPFYNYYFQGNGSEPFWNVELTADKLILNQLDKKSIHLTPAKNESLVDGVKNYALSDSNISYSISIQKKECSNTSSGEKSNYTVLILKKDENGELLDKLEGCGDYKVDKRLHDIWVLEELNGEKVSTSDFPREFPRLEIQAVDQRFLGFTGCNQMFGKINVENGMFKFKDVGATKMLCEGVNETVLLKTMELITHYQLKGTKLLLFTSNGNAMTFKKVD